MDEMFADRLPARKFRKYQCVRSAAHETLDKDENGEVETIERVSVNMKGAPKVAETIVNPV